MGGRQSIWLSWHPHPTCLAGQAFHTARPRQGRGRFLAQEPQRCTPRLLHYLHLDGEQLFIGPLPHHRRCSIQVLVGLPQRLEQREQLPELEREVLGHTGEWKGGEGVSLRRLAWHIRALFPQSAAGWQPAPQASLPPWPSSNA